MNPQQEKCQTEFSVSIKIASLSTLTFAIHVTNVSLKLGKCFLLLLVH